MDLKDSEVFMNRLMSSLSLMGAPMVFCGALVLKQLQHQTGNMSGLERETRDIDASWTGSPPEMEFLAALLQEAVFRAGYADVSVEVKRAYGNGRSAGFKFRYGSDVAASLDLTIKANPYGVQYCNYVTGVSVTGQSIVKIIADKVLVASTHLIQRRIKDMIDIYILSYIYDGGYNSIAGVIRCCNMQCGDFSIFLTKTDNLEHAYSKYNNKASILDFGIVYDRAEKFLEPFINRRAALDSRESCWNVEEGRWLLTMKS